MLNDPRRQPHRAWMELHSFPWTISHLARWPADDQGPVIWQLLISILFRKIILLPSCWKFMRKGNCSVSLVSPNSWVLIPIFKRLHSSAAARACSSEAGICTVNLLGEKTMIRFLDLDCPRSRTTRSLVFFLSAKSVPSRMISRVKPSPKTVCDALRVRKNLEGKRAFGF